MVQTHHLCRHWKPHGRQRLSPSLSDDQSECFFPRHSAACNNI